MKNSEAWSHYKDYTKDITDYGRKLGFAGAGLCWILKSPIGTFTAPVVWALAFLVMFFFTDLAQSLAGALMHRWWVRGEEIKQYQEAGSIDGEYQKPGWLDYPAFSLFLIKIAMLFLAYVAIGFGVFRT